MSLHLARPLVFFDLETTGVNVSTDKIVEISLIKLLPENAGQSPIEKTWRVKPITQVRDAKGNVIEEKVMPIPPGATAVHHITDADVASARTFKEIAPEVLDFIANCDMAGYNSNHFDVPMLQEELLNNGFDIDLREGRSFVDAFVIFQKHTPRNLTAAYKHYCKKDLEDAHSANADTTATMEVLLAQMEQHPDLPTDIKALAVYTTQQQTADMVGRLVYNEKGQIVYNFGKHKGKTIEEVNQAEPSYYNWMMNGDFPAYTKRVLKEEINRIKEAQKKAAVKPVQTTLF